MRLYCAITLCLMCAWVTGCHRNAAKPASETNLDAALVKTINNIGVENAIISQHTLYCYHFTTDGAELNELGSRDLAVLARHFAKHAGTLNVQRGEADEKLYQARIASVMGGLKKAGVDADSMRLSDGMPGGDGMSSERVVEILKKGSKSAGTMKSADSPTTIIAQ
jgi:hypothetical protein